MYNNCLTPCLVRGFPLTDVTSFLCLLLPRLSHYCRWLLLSSCQHTHQPSIARHSASPQHTTRRSPATVCGVPCLCSAAAAYLHSTSHLLFIYPSSVLFCVFFFLVFSVSCQCVLLCSCFILLFQSLLFFFDKLFSIILFLFFFSIFALLLFKRIFIIIFL